MGPTAVLRRRMMVTDAVEALAARRTAGQVQSRALILSSITAALLQSPRRRYAIRFDSLAVLSRAGVGGAWQRRREPSALARADLLLPCSEMAAETARELLRGRPTPPLVTVPIPIEPVPSSPIRDLDLIAYAGNPAKRGLDLLCRAWRRAAVADAQLIVGGIDAGEARRWLRRQGQDQPPGVTWVGRLTRNRWLELVSRARAFVSAARYEDWGIAQLEALAAATPLVTVPTPGPNEALALARRLPFELVAPASEEMALALVIQRALALSETQRAAYAAQAERLLEPYRPERVRAALAEHVAPTLLSNPS